MIEAVNRLDYFNLQKLSTFIDDLKSMKVQGQESEGADHEGG